MIEIEEGIAIRSALIVDDTEDDICELRKSLENEDVTVFYAEDDDSAKKYIKEKPEIDLIVLDWFLDGQSSLQAKLILDFLKDRIFAPVFIWTKESSKVSEIENFPKEMVMVIDKMKFEQTDLIEQFKFFLVDKNAIRIGLIWSYNVAKDMNKSLWTILKVDDTSLNLIIRSIKEGMKEKAKSDLLAESINFEAYELIQLYQKTLKRYIVNNKILLESVSEIVKTLPSDGGEIDERKYGFFRNLDMYIKPPRIEKISTGDIIKLNEKEYGIIITPSCDLFQAKVEYIVIIRAYPYFDMIEKYSNLDKNIKRNIKQILTNGIFRFHFLPFVEEDVDLVCTFEEVETIKLEDLLENLDSKLYERICTLDSPYKENFIQRFASYVNRIGEPDLSETIVDLLKNKGIKHIE